MRRATTTSRDPDDEDTQEIDITPHPGPVEPWDDGDGEE